MKDSRRFISAEEADVLVGGQLTRRSATPGIGYVTSEITEAKVVDGRLMLQYETPSGTAYKSIHMQFVRIEHLDDGRLRIEGKRFGNRPLLLQPNPDKQLRASWDAKSPSDE